ncbi:Putative flavin-containing monoamine oxidase AofH [Ascidiaceihabitans donghaensis]|uniref:Flavin-containing monoamine oxidase AofH n=1 Tax=Ascidiaceihabitans donghaensis TaxID=1510460 RepID=A0A2R8BDA9_9RHOB|nr:FAD-dependent oxidoreductase [Ascidiaceihabitans donghaensis]SPH21067.1 Putative flavin-containing monoamine oxidase AofH [Ascidiaceihabitans donghaensis]
MKTLIVGGGLSGLALAQALEAQGADYLVVEARSRFGGRILTHRDAGGYFDMGPAWFWPGQPRIAAMIARFNLQKFDQFADGVLTFENEHGQVQRGQGLSSMEGSWRLVGGLGALTDVLADGLPEGRKRRNAVVTRLEHLEGHCIATLSNNETIRADRVVLALPPRVAAQIEFFPALPVATLQTMQGVATWMAGQAKAVAVYDRPFWRDDGLSGDAMSRKGPMVEIHDASPATGGPYALFGFIGVPPNGRADEHILRQHLTAQLVRLFGPQAAEPRQLYVKDWAFDPFTATEADKAPLYAHPTYGLAEAMTDLWDGKLHFAGTEVAPVFGGYIEGALEAAENVLSTLNF